jgi:hypothetical protein
VSRRGVDDVAFASVDNPDLATERARSVANQEFHRSGEIMNEAAHRITRALEDAG